MPEGRQTFPTLTVEENLVATAAARLRRAPWTLPKSSACFRVSPSDDAISATNFRAENSKCSLSGAR